MPRDFPQHSSNVFYAPRRGSCLQFTSSTAERSPFPSRGRTMRRLRGAGLAISGYPCYRGPHPPLTWSPFPEKKEWRVKSGEWSWRPLRRLDWQYRALVSIETSSTANAVPLLLQGEGLNAALRGDRGFQHFGERSVAILPDYGRVLSFTSAGGAKPVAGRGGLEGFTPPHRLKARTAASDGQ